MLREITTEMHEAGMKAARRLAGWELGDRYWADSIIDAYLEPDGTNEDLDKADVPRTTGAYYDF